MPYRELILLLKKHFEKATGWGDSDGWTNQDFLNLSVLIKERTGAALSHVTLKRIWGRVKYDSLPNTYTLDTLSKFIGFSDWRAFVDSQQNTTGTTAKPAEEEKKIAVPVWVNYRLMLFPGLLIFATASLWFYLNKSGQGKSGNGYSFSSRTMVTSGLPNSVIFDYDATAAPADSVIIQQSWDKHLQAKVPKNGHQHTSVYYYPDFYQAKLIVNGKTVKQHELLIKSNGWLPLVGQQPVPVYFDAKDVIKDGKMSLSVQELDAHHINMQPRPPYVWYSNVADFGEIYSDDFTFETSLKNDYNKGAAACGQTKIYLLCKGTAIWIPLCAKGCISTIDLYFTRYYASGRQNDLSAFGVDFSSFVKVKIVSQNGKAQIFINGNLAYSVNKFVIRSKIIGIAYCFQGTGSVDFVRLSNEKVKYDDEF